MKNRILNSVPREGKSPTSKLSKVGLTTKWGSRNSHFYYGFIYSCLGIIAVIFLWFCLPICYGNYGIGSLFGHSLCLYAGFLTCFYSKIKQKGFKKIMDVLLAIFIIGMIYVGFLTVQICSATMSKDIPKDSTVVVLGAKVNERGVSLSFRQRLDVAYDFLVENEEAFCIVTGGQGYNEPATEASVGKAYLVEKGIAEDRIFEEGRSVNTLENLSFSKFIIEENGLNKNIAIATQNFHLYRANLQARDMGFTAKSLVAHTDPVLLPTYYARELLAITKYYFVRMFN